MYIALIILSIWVVVMTIYVAGLTKEIQNTKEKILVIGSAVKIITENLSQCVEQQKQKLHEIDKDYAEFKVAVSEFCLVATEELHVLAKKTNTELKINNNKNKPN